ncbi:MAG TPA: hypothetical protein VF397_12765 [Pyrinomonadaceae bacterium]
MRAPDGFATELVLPELRYRYARLAFLNLNHWRDQLLTFLHSDA